MTISKAVFINVARVSIHIPRVGDDVQTYIQLQRIVKISIHIPRVGDDKSVTDEQQRNGISIHIPRVGDDLIFSRNGEA